MLAEREQGCRVLSSGVCGLVGEHPWEPQLSREGRAEEGVLGGVRQGNSWTVHGPDALVLVSLGSSKRDK